jgi:hypothetical protein
MQVRFLLATTAATAAAVSLLPLSAQAATIRFGTNGILFDQTTTIQFTYVGSNHFYESSLAVYEVTGGTPTLASGGLLFQESKPTTATSPFQVNCGDPAAPASCTVNFTFQANTLYTLGLRNVNPVDRTTGLSDIVYSTTSFNTASYLDPNAGTLSATPGPYQQAVFGSSGSTGPGYNPGLFTSGVTALNTGGAVPISFEDGGWIGGGTRTAPDFTVPNAQRNDRDFNDFRITAREIPAPPLLLGLVALASRVFFRQRKSAQA